jgi:DNA repair exonuclease SbcCD ATPase subunit
VIKRLILESFGKFKRTRFDLSEVTLFVGKNESGKTTIFDALFQEICQPKANRRYGRQLQERYGGSRKAQLEFDGDELHIDEDEFYNLLAIRSGDVYLEMASGSTWMEKVKSGLFTGGIDPLRVQKTFEDRASEKGSFKHNREIKQLEGEIGRLRDQLADKSERRDSLLEREGDTVRIKADLEALQTELAGETAEKNRIERELEHERKVQEKGKLNSLLLRIREGQERDIRLKSLERFSNDELERMDRLESSLSQLKENLARGQGEEALHLKGIQEKQDRVSQLQANNTQSSNLSRLATEYLDSLKRIRENLPRRPIVWWHWLIPAALTALVGALIALSLSQENIFLFTISVGTGALLGILFLLLIGRIRSQPDSERIKDSVRRLKEEWQKRSGGSVILKSEDLDGISRELEELRAAADRQAGDFSLASGELTEQQISLREVKERNEGLRREIQTDESSIRDWLSAAGVNNRDEYLRRTHERGNLLQQQLRWEEQLREELKNRGIESVSLLQQECERRLRDYDSEHIPNRGKSEEEIHLLEGALKAESARIDEIMQKQRDLERVREREQGEISGSLGSLPEEIADLQRRILVSESRLRDMELDRRAASLVRDIFAQIAQDTENVLVELSQELAVQFGEIVPEVREISLTGLATESITVADAGGESRPIRHLSSGTRDAFLFAARLALARRGYPAAALLILDEPFHALDVERLGKALAMLRKFQLETHWQIILFSKEIGLERMCRESFPTLTVHSL